MCILKNGGSMLKYTGSSDQGLGLCCKPGFSGKHCYSSDEMICS